MLTKRIPILLNGLEACPKRKTDLNSLDFAVNTFFTKLLKTGNSILLNVVSRTFVSNYLVYYMTGVLENSILISKQESFKSILSDD